MHFKLFQAMRLPMGIHRGTALHGQEPRPPALGVPGIGKKIVWEMLSCLLSPLMASDIRPLSPSVL